MARTLQARTIQIWGHRQLQTFMNRAGGDGRDINGEKTNHKGSKPDNSHLCPRFFCVVPVSCTACVHFKTVGSGLREELDKITEVKTQSNPTCNRQADGRFLQLVFHVAEPRLKHNGLHKQVPKSKTGSKFKCRS